MVETTKAQRIIATATRIPSAKNAATTHGTGFDGALRGSVRTNVGAGSGVANAQSTRPALAPGPTRASTCSCAIASSACPNGRARRNTTTPSITRGSRTRIARASSSPSMRCPPRRRQPSHPPPSQRAQTTRVGTEIRISAPTHSAGITIAWRPRGCAHASSAELSTTRPSACAMVHH